MSRVAAPPLRYGFAGWIDRAAVYLSRFFVQARPTRWMVYDALMAAAALSLGYWLSPKAGRIPGVPLDALGFYVVFAVMAGNMVGLYDRSVLFSGARLITTAAASSLLGVLGLASFSIVVLYQPVGRWILGIAFAAQFFLILALRILVHVSSRLYKVRVLYVGAKGAASEAFRYLVRGDRHHLLIGECRDAESEEWSQPLGGIESIPDVCARHGIDEIIVGRDYTNRHDVLYSCYRTLRQGVHLVDELSFYEDALERVPVDHIREDWFYAARVGWRRPLDASLKRVLDILLAALGLVLCLPLFLVLFLLIPLTSRGPALYSQIRCGRYGHPFRIYKFRTMHDNAEGEEVKARWADKNDNRITCLGRLLRRTRLDEIPQFWNVLLGDMSLVGPRPERPEMVAEIEKVVPYYLYRHWVRPGITGLAQIRHPYGASLEDARAKLQHDLYYIKKFSILLDLQILLRTFTAMLKGAR